MPEHLQRAQLLIDQRRYDDAQEVLMMALASTPDDPLVHILLAFCFSHRDAHKEAIQHAETAVGIAPDFAYAHFTCAGILVAAGKNKAALNSAITAVRLESGDPDNHGILAFVQMTLKNWKLALEAAEAGLRIDPQDSRCLNVRAIALRSLGLTDESGLTVDSALSHDPEDPWTHANKGWTQLYARDAKGAVESFQTSLRLDPNSEWARAGLVEALKARNPIYAVILRYFLWMSNLKAQVQWGLIIGAVVGINVVNVIALKVPALTTVGTVLIFLYLLFVLTSWSAVPFFNLILRFHPEGRHALNTPERQGATWLGLVLFAIVSFDVFLLVTGDWNVWALILPFLLVFPTVMACRARPGRPRILTVLYTVGAIAFFSGGIVLQRGEWIDAYTVMCVLATWIGNIVPRSH